MEFHKNKHLANLLLSFRNLSGSELVSKDLDPTDCAFYLDQYNIKIVNYRDGFLAYYGIKIGNGGCGATRISALLRLLSHFPVSFENEQTLETSMKICFK